VHLLMYGAPDALPDLFHVIPAGIGDPFLYAETAAGRRVAVVNSLDAGKVREAGVEVLDPYALGIDELIGLGLARGDVQAQLCARACHELGIGSAVVPPAFPLAIADALRASGVDVSPDEGVFADRRRSKSPAQIEGMRRAQKAADAAMLVAAGLIRECRPGLQAEDVRQAMQAICEEHDCTLPDDVIVAPGAPGAEGHEEGTGPIAPGDPVVVDIWPRDRVSRCWADMTRTFVAAGMSPPDELLRYWTLTKASLERVYPEVRAGADTRRLFELSCEPFHAARIKTQLSKAPGEALSDGYFHSLGHGVGLELHEAPGLGRIGSTLVAGDMITLEPGCYRHGYGGCRLEDLVLVTEDGYEILTDFPYEL
jgi:Xaa-Pro aminopeptidase